MVQPLLATNDLLTKGVSVTLGPTKSYITHIGKHYPLDKAGKHFRIRTRYPSSLVMPIFENGSHEIEDQKIPQSKNPKIPFNNNSELNTSGTDLFPSTEGKSSMVKREMTTPDQKCASISVYGPSS